MVSHSTSRSNAQKQAYTSVMPATRSRMQAVRGRNTEPELYVRRTLHNMGYRFRLQQKNLPGTPDVVLPRHRKIVLVHGCFWHGHGGCKRAKLPINNADTWREKIRLNKERDQRNIADLRELGWDVLVIWECETRDLVLLESLLRRFMTQQ